MRLLSVDANILLKIIRYVKSTARIERCWSNIIKNMRGKEREYWLLHIKKPMKF